MGIETWKDTMDTEIYNTLASDPSEQKAILLAALYTLHDRFNADPMQESSAVKTAEIGDFERYMWYVRDELSDADRYIQVEEKDIASQELSHAQHFIDKAKKEAYTQEHRAAVREAHSRLSLMEQAIKQC